MNWVSVGYTTTLVGTTAYLVLGRGWDTFHAGLFVAAGGLLLPLLLLAVILPFVKKDERSEFWNVVISTAKKDFDEMGHPFRSKRPRDRDDR